MKPAPPNLPPKLFRWWETLETWQPLAFSFPVFAVLTFLINVGPFNQPILRSIFYGLFEGAVLSSLLALATRTERRPARLTIQATAHPEPWTSCAVPRGGGRLHLVHRRSWLEKGGIAVLGPVG